MKKVVVLFLGISIFAGSSLATTCSDPGNDCQDCIIIVTPNDAIWECEER